MRRWLLTSCLLLAAAGCGPRELGLYCSDTDQCEDGLMCVPYSSQEIGDNGLECVLRPLCSIPCTSDGDCTAAFGDGHICEESCGSPGACLVGGRS